MIIDEDELLLEQLGINSGISLADKLQIITLKTLRDKWFIGL